MALRVEIYSCYELTYSRIYKDVIKCIYPDYNGELILNIIDVSRDKRGRERSIQSQRHPSNSYFPRSIMIYQDDILTYYVGVSNTNYDYDKKHEKELHPELKYIFGKDGYHANSYLLQGMASYFNVYYEYKKTNPNVVFSLYLLDLDETYPHNLFNILAYRELKTIGFNVLNLSHVHFNQFQQAGVYINPNADIGYRSMDKYMADMGLISNKNGGNDPSYLQLEEQEIEEGTNIYYVNKYIFTFRALSAQGYDTLLRILCLKFLANKEGKEIEFRLGKQYFDYDADTHPVADKLTGPINNVLIQAGISVDFVTNERFLSEKKLENDTYLSFKEKNEIRNQSLFRNNLRKKGIPFRCAICYNDYDGALIAAHIWDIAYLKDSDATTVNGFLDKYWDIPFIDENNEHSSELFYKKYSLANCGDNGMWLCANHHIMFDRDTIQIKNKDDGMLHRCLPIDSEFTVVMKDDSEMSVSGQLPHIDECILTRGTKALLLERNESHRTDE